MGIKKYQCGTARFYAFIAIMVHIIASYKTDFIKVAAAVPGWRAFAGQAVFYPEHVEMTNVLLQVVRQAVEFTLIKIAECFCCVHTIKLQNSNQKTITGDRLRFFFLSLRPFRTAIFIPFI